MDPKLEFVMPQRLWLLLAVVALAASYIALQARRSRYAVRFTNLALLDRVAPKRPGWRRHLPALLLLIALTGMVGAFAQPARMTRVPRERATIIVAIDNIGRGVQGDLRGVTEGLSLLRLVGLESVARRTALELMILERRG